METVSIRIHNVPNDLVAEVKRAAQLAGQTMSGWIVEAARVRLGDHSLTITATPSRVTHTKPIVERAVEHASTRHDTKTCRIYGCLVCKELKA